MTALKKGGEVWASVEAGLCRSWVFLRKRLISTEMLRGQQGGQIAPSTSLALSHRGVVHLRRPGQLIPSGSDGLEEAA